MNTKKINIFVDTLAYEGKGVARAEGKVVFVRNGVPGDLLEVEIIKNKKNFAEGKILKILEPSPYRIDPICEHFGECGGCSFQNISYEQQLEWKHKFVADAFERIAKIPKVEIKKVIPASKIFGYRNKMEFSFGTSRWITEKEVQSGKDIDEGEKHFALGFHIPERFDKVLDINRCFLQDEKGNLIINAIREKAKEFRIPAYNLKTHFGFLRNVVLRFSALNGEITLNLVTTSKIGENEKNFLSWFETFFSKLEFITNLVHTTNDSLSPTVTGNYRIIKGTGYLFEELKGVRFRISPFSFFQVNTKQAESLVEKVIEYATPKDKMIWDLYSGAGTFSLPLARSAKKVIGFESVESAVEDAKFNAKLNNIENVSFFVKDLHTKKIFQELIEFEKPDIIIIDPPRTGIHKNLLLTISKILPEKIVYVSCNPTTMARDCYELSKYYKVVEIQPVDMFPQTYHIETIGLLIKQ
ncbi:MAG: 23S rRNA (uracil(1939)-C(5))-methyltransferase RlmD [Ignavibacteria bacterium]|nr:23S rRNA (uracil(1939)-C(5))-methyltransferase RlmD [Ignavibacteria bacterium]